ncbi:cytochrome P450, partial [Coniochaeta sp. 2T2.1]
MAVLPETMESVTLIRALVIAGASYMILLVVYRLFFHPLSHIPGPRLAAVTYWYESYYDIIKSPGGQYWHKLEELHKIYGPIIRINPDEVQINDPEWYNKIYAGGSIKRNRYARSVAGNGAPGSMASAVSHDLHRLRRGSLNPFMSKAAVQRLEGRIQSQLSILCRRLSEFMGRGEIVDIGVAMTALTLDIITEYSFGESWKCVDKNDLSYDFISAMRGGFETLQIRKQFTTLLELIPPKFLRATSPQMEIYFDFKDETQVNLFTEALDSLPSEETDTQRMADEAIVVITAGSETTSRVLVVIFYYVLTDQKVLAKLLRELDAAMPDMNSQISSSELESLPYLTAVIREALRLSNAVPNRSLLTADEPLQYKQYTLKPGTPVCMSTSKYLVDERIHANANTFDPERWLGDPQHTQELLRHFAPFSKGHRSSFGQNLAYTELYLASAYVFRRFEMRLHDVVRERDVDSVRDAFIGLPSPQSKGVRLEILAKR